MAAPGPPGAALLDLYDRALPQVYGYLVGRCGDRSLAEDLTAETFLAAAGSPPANAMTVGWLIGVARHKLADHWRWQARQERLLDAVAGEASVAGVAGVAGGACEADDPWEVRIDRLRAREVLARVAPQHRAALTLRYLDGLSVPEVAGLMERTVEATEALLVRARRQFRAIYEDGGGDDDA